MKICRVRSVLVLVALLSIVTNAIAQKDTDRVLVHTLNYIATDYQYAVKEGAVTDAEEYEEMKEFAGNAGRFIQDLQATQGNSDTLQQIAVYITELSSLIQQKAAVSEVNRTANAAKNLFIQLTGFSSYPATFPNLSKGKQLYMAQCALCHGMEGKGDGPGGKDLNPAPRNFTDAERMSIISPAHAFNTIRLGVEGTSMEAYPDYTDEEVWDLAFYVLAIRYGQTSATESAGLLNRFSVEQIATLSDAELKLTHKLTDVELAVLRTAKPDKNENQFIQKALQLLTQCQTEAEKGNYDAAFKLAALAYLEGVEPLELSLKASDPEMAEKIEAQILTLREQLKSRTDKAQIITAITDAKNTLHEIEQLLHKKEYSFWMAFFLSISIILREGLEAFLVIMVILSILNAGGIKATQWVHAGWIFAILCGIGLWFLSGTIIQNSVSRMEFIEAFVSLLAVAMLLYIGFWLHGKSEIGKWQKYVKELTHNAMKNKGEWGLFTLSFIVVFREVFESVLFLSALHIESGGQKMNAILLGVVTAAAITLSLAVIAIRFSAKLPIPKLFKISAFVMGLMAVVLTGKGFHSLQETGYMSIHELPVPRIELLGVYPTVETTAAQVVIFVLVFIIWNYKSAK
jgi:high-affinity iron transporter